MTTAFYAALLAILFVALSIYVIRSRRRLKVALGDGNKDGMRQATRAHGNFAEYAPLFLILLGLAEHQGLPWWAVHLLGALFLLGRLLHAYGVAFKERYKQDRVENLSFRVRGMVLTFTTILACAGILLAQYAITLLG